MTQAILPGDLVKVTPRDGFGSPAPIVEGYVSAVQPTYVTIRGLGYTQFQLAQFNVTFLRRPEPEVRWQVHVLGPDDLLPAKDAIDAHRQALKINYEHMTYLERSGFLEDASPILWAVPERVRVNASGGAE